MGVDAFGGWRIKLHAPVAIAGRNRAVVRVGQDARAVLHMVTER